MTDGTSRSGPDGLRMKGFRRRSRRSRHGRSRLRACVAGVATVLVVGLLGGCSGGPLTAAAAGEDQQQQNAYGDGVFDPTRLPPEARQYVKWIMKAGGVCAGVTPEIVAGIIQAESSWRPRLNEGAPGKAHGIAQFDDPSWSEHGKDADGDGKTDVYSPADAIVSAGHYLCFIQDKVNGYIKDKKIPGLLGKGNVRDLMIVGYNKGPYIWLQEKWNGKPIHFDSDGIPDAEDGNGTDGREYLAMVNKAIDSFRSRTGSGAVPATGVRLAMKEAALAEVDTFENPRGSNCQKYSPRCVQWCALFASWVWDKGGFKFAHAAVLEFWKFGMANNTFKTDFRTALPGDTVIYDHRNDPFFHIGVIVEVYKDGQIATVEGNSGRNTDQVAYYPKFDPSERSGIGYVSPVTGK